MEEFATCFEQADEVWITEIYPASEPPIVGVSGKRLAKIIKEATGQRVHFLERVFDLPDAVCPTLFPGDVVFTLGAGAIGRVGPILVERLQGNEVATVG